MAPKAKTTVSACSSPPPTHETSTSGSGIKHAKRRILEDEVITAKLLREKHAEDIFPGLDDIMKEVWGNAPKNRRGFKEERVQDSWSSEFYRYYEMVYSKKQVTNHYISTYFARAFALHLKGRLVDWVDVSKDAKELAKTSDLTEDPITMRSSNIKQEAVVKVDAYDEADFETMNQLLKTCAEEKIAFLNEIEDLEAKRREAQKVISKIEGRKEMLSEDLQEISKKIAEAKIEFERLKNNPAKPADNQVSFGVLKYKMEDLIVSRNEKDAHVLKLDTSLQKSINEISVLEQQLGQKKNKLTMMDLVQQRQSEIVNLMGRSAPVHLQPRPFATGASSGEQSHTFSCCTCCGQGFGETALVLLPPCRDAYWLFCLTFLVQQSRNCIKGCSWDETVQQQLGLSIALQGNTDLFKNYKSTVSSKCIQIIEASESTKLPLPDSGIDPNKVSTETSTSRSPARNVQQAVQIRDWNTELADIEQQAAFLVKPAGEPATTAASVVQPGAGCSAGGAAAAATGSGTTLSSSTETSREDQRSEAGTDPDFEDEMVKEGESEEEEELVPVKSPKQKQKAVQRKKEQVKKQQPAKTQTPAKPGQHKRKSPMKNVALQLRKRTRSGKVTGSAEVKNLELQVEKTVSMVEQSTRQDKEPQVQAEISLATQTGSEDSNLIDRLKRLVPFTPYRDCPPKPAASVFINDVEELCWKLDLTPKMVDMYGRYLCSSLSSDWKNKFHVFRPESYVKYVTAIKNKNSADIQNTYIIEGLDGFVMGRTQWIFVPMLYGSYWSLAIFVMAANGKTYLPAVTSPSIQILNPEKGHEPDVKFIQKLHKLVINSMMMGSNSLVHGRKNFDATVERPPVPVPPSSNCAGMYIAAYMQSFVDAMVAGVPDSNFMTASWFNEEYAKSRRAHLVDALIVEGELNLQTVAAVSTSKGESSHSVRRLIIFDLNSVLGKSVHKAEPANARYKRVQQSGLQFELGNRVFYCRPGLAGLLAFVKEEFDVAFWSSLTSRNMQPIVDTICERFNINPKFTFSQDECWSLPHSHPTEPQKGLYVKPLAVLWQQYPEYYGKTVLIDDERYKSTLNPAGSYICPFSWTPIANFDNTLVMELIPWLGGLRRADDVSTYVKEHPIQNVADGISSQVEQILLVNYGQNLDAFLQGFKVYREQGMDKLPASYWPLEWLVVDEGTNLQRATRLIRDRILKPAEPNQMENEQSINSCKYVGIGTHHRFYSSIPGLWDQVDRVVDVNTRMNMQNTLAAIDLLHSPWGRPQVLDSDLEQRGWTGVPVAAQVPVAWSTADDRISSEAWRKGVYDATVIRYQAPDDIVYRP